MTASIGVDPHILENRDDHFSWKPRILLSPCIDTKLPATEKILEEMASTAARFRVQTEKSTGEKLKAIEIKRYFIIAGRILTIVILFEFRDMGNGIEACGMPRGELVKWAQLGRQIRAFLN